MLDMLWLIPALPYAGFLALILVGGRLARRITAVIAVGSVGLAAVLSIATAVRFISSPPAGNVSHQTLWNWIEIGSFQPSFGFYLDSLSMVFVLVITIVGFLIHLYSVEYMIEDDAYSRFFAYMNLFVGSMLLLVLADNLLALYLGWEGVGICSYLLIGFWYRDPANGRAAIKAFVTTRFGDTLLATGLFVLFTSLGTLDIQSLLLRATQEWPSGSTLAVAAAALLLGGAVGKSAQLPLQTWLPDAMAGPTPVSALIHAATMVTAGVYLIARMNVLYTLAPAVQTAVAVIGVLTLLIAGFSALTESDIKRVLAYSTISQIGYLFLALGVGAWNAAIFHFLTHACFKALLFLGAGAIMVCVHEERNMFRLGGLRTRLPLVFWTFLAGAASLAALPFVTAGFYSKDPILLAAWSAEQGGSLLWLGGLAGAFLTSVYTFRMVFLTFFGEAKQEPARRAGFFIKVPLIILALLSVVVGFIEVPKYLGDVELISQFLSTSLPGIDHARTSTDVEPILDTIAAIVCLAGVYLAYVLFVQRHQYAERLSKSYVGAALHGFWLAGWGFDRLYDHLFVRPFVWMAHTNQADFLDSIYRGIAELSRLFHEIFSELQTGNVRRYAMGVALGAIVGIAIMVLAIVHRP